MDYSFFAYGHKNILATHKTTIEFTKDRELSLRGNCILGVNADFNLIELKKSMKTIINENMSETQSLKNRKAIFEKPETQSVSQFVSEHAQKSVSNQRFVTDTKNAKHFSVSMISDKSIKNKIKMIINLDGISDEIIAELNPDFDDDKEIVIRMGEFKSKRTLGVRADKAAAHVKRELAEKLKNPEQKIMVSITNI